MSGSVRLSNTGRLATAKSISGDIEMADSKADGALSAGSVSGTVRLRGVTARTLALSTVSGNVIVEDVTSERVDAQAISGNVAFMGNLAPNGRYEFTSHSGNVRIAVDGKTGFQLEATSFSGGISSDLPISARGLASGRELAARQVWRRQRHPGADELLRQHLHHQALTPTTDCRVSTTPAHEITSAHRAWRR